jgi:hypothetical protein
MLQPRFELATLHFDDLHPVVLEFHNENCLYNRLYSFD